MVRRGLLCFAALAAIASAADPVNFARDVEPVLQKHCVV